MAAFKKGDLVAVPCDVRPGAFSGELLVTAETVTGPISGFANSRDIVNNKAILGRVLRASTANVLVKLSGSFFTTNGLAEFRASVVREAPVPA
jgi:hypothetical protein